MKLLKVSGVLLLSSSLLFGCSNNMEKISNYEKVKDKVATSQTALYWGNR